MKSSVRLVSLISAMTCALLLAACGQNKVAEKPPEPGDTAVARVNGQVIWASDVKREAVAQGLISEGEPLDISSEVFRQRLDEVIDQKLLAAEATKRKLDKDPIAQRRLAAARERILGDMLVEGVVEKAVTEDAIRKLYAEQQKLSKRSEEIRARQIIVGSQAEAGTSAAGSADQLRLQCEAIANTYLLSKREAEVMFFLARGFKSSYVQKKLYISEGTAKTHIRHIYRKLDVHSQQELMRLVDTVEL